MSDPFLTPLDRGVSNATQPSDTLSSKQFATFIDVLSEGEIEGFPSAIAHGYTRGTANYTRAALKDVFLNGTSVLRQNADPANVAEGDYNFQNVTFDPRFGENPQTYISGIPDQETVKGVGVVVTTSAPVIRSITNQNVTAIRVTVAFPVLQKYEDDGNITGSSVQLKISLEYTGGSNSGGYALIIDNTVTGKTSSLYQRDYRINFDATNTDWTTINVKVERVTADSTDAKLVDAFQFQGYTELIDTQRPYNGIAHSGIRFDAEQFPQVPQRMFRIKGIKVPIPANGTVNATTGAISYAGAWNGTFKTNPEWTSDPCWLLHELLVNTTFGLGDHITASQLDKWAFYAASSYASTSVSNGEGAFEPRFSCNAYIQTQEQAYDLINNLCSVMRVMPYWSTGSLTISQDKAADPAYLFTLANVLEGGFSYSGSDIKSRHTIVNVSYFNNDSQDMDWETVEDTTLSAKYGQISKDIKAFGCTSRGQAARMGRAILYADNYQVETVSFQTSLAAGIICRPGQVIEVADPVKAGVRRGGQIKTATTTQITVDDTAATDLPTTGNPTLSVILPNGTVESKTVSGISGAVITVSSAYSSAPNPNSVWVLQNDSVKTTQWRVINVTEQEGSIYTVTGLTYSDSKYTYIEDGSTLPERPISVLNEIPNSPSGLVANEVLYESNGLALAKINISWNAEPRVSQYEVQWTKGSANDNWRTERITRPDFEILDTSAGTYQVRVFSLSAILQSSTNPSTLSITAFGKTAPPADVSGAYLNVLNSQSAELAWTQHPDLDVKLGGSILIRHTPRTSGATWANSTTLVPAAAGSQTRKVVPFLAGSYLLKAKDDTGNESSDVARIVQTAQAEAEQRNVVRVTGSPAADTSLTFEESSTTPKFQGNLTNMLYSAERDALILANGVDIDSITDNIDDWTSIDALGGVKASGEYTFGGALELGGVFDVNLRSKFTTLAFNPGNFWDDLPLIDSLATIDDVIGDPDADLLFRYSADASSPTYSDWIIFNSNLIRARHVQFKVVATSGDQRENIAIDQLGVTALLQQHNESAGPLTSGTTTYTATFPNAFYAVPQVNITALDMGTGDYVAITNVTRTNFQVLFKNSSGSNVSRQFHYSANGTGKEVT